MMVLKDPVGAQSCDTNSLDDSTISARRQKAGLSLDTKT
jgi:hypothetical protein